MKWFQDHFSNQLKKGRHEIYRKPSPGKPLSVQFQTSIQVSHHLVKFMVRGPKYKDSYSKGFIK